MTIPTETLEHWLQDSKKATQGKFKAFDSKEEDDKRVCVQHCPDSQMRTPELLLVGGLDTGGDCETVLTFEDARHIANACPQNFAALIEELLQLRSMTHKDEWKKVNIRGVEVEVLGVKNDPTD